MTPTPESEARFCCPHCGGADFGHISGFDGRYGVECHKCRAVSPAAKSIPMALTAFCHPSHALASASALLREAREMLLDRERDQYDHLEDRSFCGGCGETDGHLPNCAHPALLLRIDRELAKEAV